jgi:hypothetical protein
VRSRDDQADMVEQILHGQSGVDASTRGAAYREAGWTGYQPDAPAYSADEIARERVRYGAEPRTFGDHEPGVADDLLTTNRPGETPNPGGGRFI